MRKLSPFPLLKHLSQRCPHLSDRERSIALTLAIERQSLTTVCKVSIRDLARFSGHGTRSVVKTIKSLEAKGIIELNHGQGTRPHSYTFSFDKKEANEIRENNSKKGEELPF